MNIVAPPSGFSLADRFLRTDGQIYLTGMQALVRLAIDQQRADGRHGLRTAGLISGYPGSPLGGFDIEIGRQGALLAQHDVRYLPGLNEDLAATALWGTQMLHAVDGARFDGVFGMWFGKAPGLDRSADALRHGNIRGVARNGGVLVVVGDDPRPVSSMIPSDSNLLFKSLQMPLLAPGDVQDLLDLGLHGYALSRAAGLWVGFKIVSSLADSAATVQVSPGRVSPVLPEFSVDGRKFAPVLRLNEAGAPMAEAERDLFYVRLEMARRYSDANALNRIVVNPASAWLGIAAAGKSFVDLRQALHDLGLDDAAMARHGIRLLQIRMPYPLAPRVIHEFAEGLAEILVIEEKGAFLEDAIRSELYGTGRPPRVLGKFDAAGGVLVPAHGELDADLIARAVASRLAGRGEIASVAARIAWLDRALPPAIQLSTARGAYLCSGCPHSRSLDAPEEAIVGAGIGCHVMALYLGKESFGKVLGYTHMGGEGAQWAGLAPFTDRGHFIQNIGDGTFAHSGSLALRFAVSSGANITYKLLYNQAISMTGGQAITGAMSVPAILRMLQAEGVKRIIVTTDAPEKYRGVALPAIASVRHRDEIIAVERELARVAGVTVMLHDQQCAAEKRRLRKRDRLATPEKTVFINERVCEGCGDCGRKSNCLSVQPVQTEFGRKTRIHHSSCNKDFSCLLGDCPSFVTVEGTKAARAEKAPVAAGDFSIALPSPQPPGEQFALVMTGIGGTGVVTVNQILCTAAVIDGYHVRALDITGFSQKAGPVVSELQISRQALQLANTISAGKADLYLVFDQLVGVTAANLAKADPERTVAVVSASEVPTGRMVADKDTHYPDTRLLRKRIDGATRRARNVYIDAQHIAVALLGDHMAGNMVMIGAAWQTGTLPLSLQAIEQAVRVNGVAVEMNLAALALGRLAVADPAKLEALMAAPVAAGATTHEADAATRAMAAETGAAGELLRMLEVRIGELTAYQNRGYADRYAKFVAAMRAAEQAALPGEERFSRAVASNLYKLMAYKDEYEVARLLLADAPGGERRAMFGDSGRVYWHLHPSFLRALGVRRKVKLGGWFAPALRLLRALRILRGSRLDVFGLGRLRRAERALIDHYQAMTSMLAKQLNAENHALAVELAQLADMVRGYETIKHESIAAYLEKLDAGLAKFGIASVPMPGRAALATSRARAA